MKSFTTSMTALTDAIAARRAAILESASGRQKVALPEALRLATDAEMARLAGEKALKRIWKSDPTLFSKDPAHEKSIKSRLGWLRAPAAMSTPPKIARAGGVRRRGAQAPASPTRSCWGWAAARSAPRCWG